MIQKRKRNEEDIKKCNLKNEVLPIATQQLTNYHVSQLQESNKYYRKRVDELENEVNRITEILGKVDNDSNNEDEILSNLKDIIKKKDDEILNLQNENRRLSMQNVFNNSYQLKDIVNKTSNQKDLNKTLNKLKDTDNMDIVNITENDLLTKIKIKEDLIIDMDQKYQQIFKENLFLKKELAIFAPCRENIYIQNIENKPDDDNIFRNKICKCTETFSEEISFLKDQLEKEKQKSIDIINNELFNGIKHFLESHKSCEEQTKVISDKLFDLKDKYDKLNIDFYSLENNYKNMEIKERDYKKKIRELELINNKFKDNQYRITEFIKKVNSNEYQNKDELMDNLMNEYEELSNAFEEKSVECDNLNQKIKEIEENCLEYNTGIENIRKSIQELDTVKILYEEKLSLIRKKSKIDTCKNNSNFNNFDNSHDYKKIINLLEDYPSIYKNDNYNEPQDFLDVNKNLVKFKSLSENLKSELQFYQDQCENLKNQIEILQINERSNYETISILRSRVQYILNRVRRLTDLKISIDENEKNEHLQIDDYNKEIDNLKLENQQLLTLMKCSVCRDKLKDTVINRCGHLFCKGCIESNLSSRNRKCPLCHTTFDKNDTNRIFLD